MSLVPALDLRPAANDVTALPSNIEAEQALLGCILYDNAAFERVDDALAPNHFFEPFHQRLWAAIVLDVRAGKLCEPIMLATRFASDPAFEAYGGVRYLADLIDRAPPAPNAPDYANHILDLALRREVTTICQEAAQAALKAEDGQSGREVIEDLEGRLFALAEHKQGQGFALFADSLASAIENIGAAFMRDGTLSGLSTGLIDVDQKTGGLHPSDLVILAARPSMGKAQPLDAKVLRRDGTWARMGDLQLGDHLASVDGALSRVLEIHPQGEKPIFKVSFSDGRSTRTCAEHLWRVHYRSWVEPRVLSTAEVSAMLTRARYRGRIWIEAASGDFGADELPLDPWILGALIGDGKLSDGTPIFTSADSEVVAEMNRRAAPDIEVSWSYGIAYRLRTVGGRTRGGVQGVVPNRITDALKALGLHGKRSEAKFIPERYLQASRDSRLALLRGLLDTDGWVETFGPVRFCTTSPRLAVDVVTLVRSLGGQASTNTRAPTYTHDGEKRDGLPAYVINIQNLVADDLFTIERKRSRVRSRARHARLTFSAIEPVGFEAAQCISVSNHSHLYITDDYIVTHNTALATNIAFNVAKHYQYEVTPEGGRKTLRGGIVAFFSLEMSKDQLTTRILSEVSGISSDKLRKGEIQEHEYSRLRDAAVEISEIPLYIDDTGGISIAKLGARARRLKRRVGLDLIIVDYLQLATAAAARHGANRVEQLTEITTGLKALAKELGVPVIALSQLSRAVENREDKKPQLSDLRESGSIEQDADMVMFVYRESYYLSRLEPREDTTEHMEWQASMDACRHLADLIIGKQRHGPIGTIRLGFNEKITKFSNLARDGAYGAVQQRLLHEPADT